MESLTSDFAGMELALRQLTVVTEAYSLPEDFLESVLLAARMERVEELLAADGNDGFPGLDVAAVRKRVTAVALSHHRTACL